MEDKENSIINDANSIESRAANSINIMGTVDNMAIINVPGGGEGG